MIIAALVTIIQNWKQSKYPSVNEDKQTVVYPYNRILLSSIKEQITEYNTYLLSETEAIR